MKSFAAVAAFVAAAHAATLTNSEYNITAGKTFPITWSDASGPVAIELDNGSSGNLQSLGPVATGQSSTDGSGSFTWTVPASVDGAGPFALKITDDVGSNYSPQFDIDNIDVVFTSTGSVADSATVTQSASTGPVVVTSTSTSVQFTITTSSFAVSTSSFFATSSSPTGPTPTPTKSTGKTKPSGGNSPGATSTPPDSNGDGNGAAGLASPLALIVLTVAAMFYLH